MKNISEMSFDIRNSSLLITKLYCVLSFQISKNPITTNGAISLLETYQENEESALTRLELLVSRLFSK